MRGKWLIHILILFFLLLLIYQFYSSFFEREGLENNENTLQLEQQNTDNIAYLKQEITNANFPNLKKEIYDISMNMVAINQQIQALLKQQTDAATKAFGSGPHNITGAS